jgi:hypothetical protein
MGTAFLVIFYLVTGAATLAVNYVIWFIALPMAFRNMRDQLRQARQRKNPD